MLKGLTGDHRAFISRVDEKHGSLHAAYAEMGKPVSPTRAQIEVLRRAAELPPPETVPMQGGRLQLTLPPHGLAVVEIR